MITGGDQPAVESAAELGVEIVAPRIAPGAMIGPYELLDQIGGGGMGRVFRAFETSVGRTVALKLLSPNQAADPQTLARFQNEARAAGRLNHPNVIQVYSAGEVQGIPFIALEFIDGKNVRAVVEESGPLTVGEAVRYAIYVAEALDHAWSRGVVHRDVKASNVLVAADGRVKLIDFGLARMYEGNTRSRDLTSSGMTLGTFDYIAPEQARDPRLADIRSDIYSLGCTLFFMLAGRPPFPGGTVLQKLLQHQAEEPPEIRKLRKDVPESLSRVLRKMMAKSPRQRYQTAAQLIEALSEVLAEVSQHFAGRLWGGPESRSRRTWQKHLPWLIPIALFFLGTVALDWWWSPAALQGLPGDEIYDLPLSPEGTPALPTQQPETAVPGKQTPELPPPAAASESGPSTPPAFSPSDVVPGSQVGGVTGTTPSSSFSSLSANTASQDVGGSFEMASRLDSILRGGDAQALSDDGLLVRPNGIATSPLPSIRTENGPRASSENLPERTPGDIPSGSQPASPNRLSPLGGANESGGEMRTPDGRTAPLAASPAAGSESRQPLGAPAPSTAHAILVVDPHAQSAGRFPTFSAALAAARNGDEIRLDFDGPLEVEPCDVRGRNLVIAAAAGRQPELLLRPAAGALFQRQRTFFAAAGADLTFREVAIRAENVSSFWPDTWSVMYLDFGSQVALDRCVVTIAEKNRIAEGQATSGRVFEIRSDPQSHFLLTGGLPSQGAASRPIGVSLKDCVIRGEASSVWIGDGQPVNVSLRNCLFSTTGPLLDVAGSDLPSTKESLVSVTAENVTCVVRSNVARVVPGEFRPYSPQIQIDSRASIWVGLPQGVFIEHAGMDAEEALVRLRWRGDRNFYERFAILWRIAREPSLEPLDLRFDAWRNYWRWQNETAPAWGAVPWSRPLPDAFPPHDHTPRDFALMDPLIDDAAIGLTGQVGCLADHLPAVTTERTPGP